MKIFAINNVSILLAIGGFITGVAIGALGVIFVTYLSATVFADLF